MDKELKRMIQRINEFVETLIVLRDVWEEIRAWSLGHSNRELENAPLPFQSLVSNFGHSEFDVMMPRLLQYCRAYGGFEILLSLVEDEEPETVNEEDED